VITLITGTPGAGKTAYAVSELEKLLKSTPRPVYVMGIPELTLDHNPANEVAEWTRRERVPEDPTLEEAYFTFPDGSLVIVDEAQKVYRPRGTSAKVPDHVSAFERHRHLGLDFWLITQNPALLDLNVRKLVGKHIHLRASWSGRQLYEWPECSNVESRSVRALAASRSYRLPKRVFGLYKSASLHVEHKRRVPVQVYVLAVVLAVAAVIGWYVFGRLSSSYARFWCMSGD
jgi:zona occludens toxin